MSGSWFPGGSSKDPFVCHCALNVREMMHALAKGLRTERRVEHWVLRTSGSWSTGTREKKAGGGDGSRWLSGHNRRASAPLPLWKTGSHGRKRKNILDWESHRAQASLLHSLIFREAAGVYRRTWPRHPRLKLTRNYFLTVPLWSRHWIRLCLGSPMFTNGI